MLLGFGDSVLFFLPILAGGKEEGWPETRAERQTGPCLLQLGDVTHQLGGLALGGCLRPVTGDHISFRYTPGED